ncbi:MAG: type IV pilus assembly protein PilM [Thermodesulfobacteriota bacterium]
MGLGALWPKKRGACALDLGSAWIKVVRLVPGKADPQLERLGRVPWPGHEKEGVDANAQRLQQMWQALELKDKVVASSMAGHAVIVKRVRFAKEKIRHLDAEVHKEAKQYIPFDINDVYLDFQDLGPDAESSDSHQVLLVASKKKMVHEVQSIFSAAGLGISILDVDGFALANCFTFNYPEWSEKPTYLLDIGAQQSVFCVCVEGRPLFLREIALGGNQMTERISKALEISKFEAEKIKINGPEAGSTTHVDLVQDVLYKVFVEWTQEIRRMLTFYQSSESGGLMASRMLLAGGGSLISGVSEHFAEYLDMEVGLLDPFRRIKISSQAFDGEYLKNIGPQFAVGTGLALRQVV